MDDGVNTFDYSNYYDEENLNVPEFVTETYKTVIGSLEPFRKTGRFLDVGCGAGTLLKVADEMGWDVEGVDVSDPATAHLSDLGFKAHKGTLQDVDFPDDYFDVVTCTEVIEHVDQPRELVSEIARVLRPKGAVWMTTPNSNGISAKLLGLKWSVVSPPEHLNLFSKRAMKMCLSDAGFSEMEFAFTGINPFEILRGLRSEVTSSDAAPSGDVKENFNRVEKGYKLNKFFLGTKFTRKVKEIINSLLSATSAGDTLKVLAKLD